MAQEQVDFVWIHLKFIMVEVVGKRPRCRMTMSSPKIKQHGFHEQHDLQGVYLSPA